MAGCSLIRALGWAAFRPFGPRKPMAGRPCAGPCSLSAPIRPPTPTRFSQAEGLAAAAERAGGLSRQQLRDRGHDPLRHEAHELARQLPPGVLGALAVLVARAVRGVALTD